MEYSDKDCGTIYAFRTSDVPSYSLAVRYHATIAGLDLNCSGKSKSQVPNRRRLVIQVLHVTASYYAHNCMLLSIVFYPFACVHQTIHFKLDYYYKFVMYFVIL